MASLGIQKSSKSHSDGSTSEEGCLVSSSRVLLREGCEETFAITRRAFANQACAIDRVETVHHSKTNPSLARFISHQNHDDSPYELLAKVESTGKSVAIQSDHSW